MFKNVMFVTAMLLALPSFGASKFVDDARLRECGGRVELRESKDNLHLQFEDVRRCDRLVIKTAWHKTLESYDLNPNSNFTLSNEMWRELGEGKLILEVSGRRGVEDVVSLKINFWGGNLNPGHPHHPYPKHKCGGHEAARYTGFARTNACVCAWYEDGRFIRHAKLWENLLGVCDENY